MKCLRATRLRFARLGKSMLSDDQIDHLAEYHGLDFAVYEPFARAIEAEVRKDYDALIRQLVDVLKSSSPHTDSTYAWKDENWTAKRAAAISAARTRLATTTKESPCSTK